MSGGNSVGVIRIGVVADTHVPDRALTLHPGLIAGLQAWGVQSIFHAGDICVPAVVRELETVAPVTAVGGNRDWVFRYRLPGVRLIDVNGVAVALVHGHGGFLPYFMDKWYYLAEGYRLSRYLKKLRKAALAAKVVVFGHTHQPANQWEDDQLFFNPGSACIEPIRNANPSYGILHFSTDGSVHGEVIRLDGARLENRRWVPDV